MGGMTNSRPGGLIGFDLVTGAADSSTVGISITDSDGNAAKTTDEIIACIELAQTTNAWADRTAAAEIITGSKLTVPTSTNDVVAVWFMKTDPAYNEGRVVSSPYIRAEIGTGALANTNIAISGSHTTDVLVSAVEVDATSGAWTDRTAASSFTSDGYLRCTASTNGNSVFVIWMDTNYEVADAAVCWKFAITTMGLSDESDITLTGVATTDSIPVCVAFDETSYAALDAIQPSEITISAANTFQIDQVSPTATSGAKMFTIWHDRQQ